LRGPPLFAIPEGMVDTLRKQLIRKGAELELVELRKRMTLLESILLTEGTPTAKRNGRRKMSAEERHAVSERMKKYWAKRRKAR
jgi:hypothetical protein